MGMIEEAAKVLGFFVVAVGLLGGILSLPMAIKKLRRDLRPHGDRGVGFCVVSREDTPSGIRCTLLVVDDLFHFVGGWASPDMGARISAIEHIGDYYKVDMTLPPGQDHFLVRKKR